ncbi:hypothetical protein ONO23_04892 [Micromonospora noduli]|nr:hypothetical protein ONO23_04892 [Micromonospora noduli]
MGAGHGGRGGDARRAARQRPGALLPAPVPHRCAAAGLRADAARSATRRMGHVDHRRPDPRPGLHLRRRPARLPRRSRRRQPTHPLRRSRGQLAQPRVVARRQSGPAGRGLPTGLVRVAAVPRRRATARPCHGCPRSPGAGRDVGPHPARHAAAGRRASRWIASGDGGNLVRARECSARTPKARAEPGPSGGCPAGAGSGAPATRLRRAAAPRGRGGSARRRSAASDRAAPARAGQRSAAPHRPAVPVHPVGDRRPHHRPGRAWRGLAGSDPAGRRRRPRSG